jgi:aqualysin 1
MSTSRSFPAQSRSLLSWALAALLLLLLSAWLPTAAAQGLAPERSRYIVVFHDRAQDVTQQAQAMANGAGTRPEHIYTRVLKGFSITLPTQGASAFLEAMRRHPLVDYIEPDQPVSASDLVMEAAASWGLDRIDQRSGLDGYYGYDSTGLGVRVYVLDSGVRATHVEFGGRVLPGYSLVNDSLGTGDCTGHGTQVASVAAGRTFGAAKSASIVPVRVFDCNNNTSWSTVIAGLDWIAAQGVRPAVVNLSLSGGLSSTTETAITSLYNQGIVATAAAGNEGVDACTRSPSRQPIVMTVGATQRSPDGGDSRLGLSNYGTCVDLFAPGSGIRMASHLSDIATTSNVGTSFSAPHAAGLLARLFEENPAATPAEVSALLQARATVGTVMSAGPDSPVLMLYSGSDAAPANASIRVANLSASRKASGKSWTATVRLTVRDLYARPVAGARVSGRFSTASSDQACTTDSAGSCSLTSPSMSTGVASTTLTVTGVSGNGPYAPAYDYSNALTVSLQ